MFWESKHTFSLLGKNAGAKNFKNAHTPHKIYSIRTNLKYKSKLKQNIKGNNTISEKKTDLKFFSRTISLEKQGCKVIHDCFSFSKGLTCQGKNVYHLMSLLKLSGKENACCMINQVIRQSMYSVCRGQSLKCKLLLYRLNNLNLQASD